MHGGIRGLLHNICPSSMCIADIRANEQIAHLLMIR